MGICDRIAVLDFGEKIAEGLPARGPERPAGHRGLPGGAGRCFLSSRTSTSTTARSRRSRASRCRRRRGRDRHADRRQRRRQDHHAEDDLRAAAAVAAGTIMLRRPATSARLPGHKRVRPGHRPGAGGPRHLPRHDRRTRTSRWAPTRARASVGQASSTEVFELFPRLAERKTPGRRHALRRRAADARHRPGADGQAARCCCSTSRRWAWRRCWSQQIFDDHRGDQPRRARRCCWSSRTPQQALQLAHRATCWRPGAWSSPRRRRDAAGRPAGAGGVPGRRPRHRGHLSRTLSPVAAAGVTLRGSP